MIAKELFIKRMQLIQNFHSEQDTLNVLIDKLTDGFPVVTMGGYLVREILNTLNDDLGLSKENDILDWWLYEDVEKVIYYNDEEISVRTLEELYDYIISETKEIDYKEIAERLAVYLTTIDIDEDVCSKVECCMKEYDEDIATCIECITKFFSKDLK